MLTVFQIRLVTVETLQGNKQPGVGGVRECQRQIDRHYKTKKQWCVEVADMSLCS